MIGRLLDRRLRPPAAAALFLATTAAGTVTLRGFDALVRAVAG